MSDLKQQLQKALASVSLARRFYYFEEIGSTSDWARNFIATNGAAGDLHGTVVVAGHQTSGRGRFRRQWKDEPGKSLLFSIILDSRQALDLSQSTVVAAVSVCEAIREVTGLATLIKYPNDIVHAGKKLAGILIETASIAGRGFHIVGIGINVNQTRMELPADTRIPSGSLASQTGAQTSLAALLKVVLLRLGENLKKEPARIAERLNYLCDTIGRSVHVNLDDGEVAGTAIAVDDDGALLVRTESGGTVRVISGEVLQVN